jgi:hypothetical protein
VSAEEPFRNVFPTAEGKDLTPETCKTRIGTLILALNLAHAEGRVRGLCLVLELEPHESGARQWTAAHAAVDDQAIYEGLIWAIEKIADLNAPAEPGGSGN